MPDDLNYGGLEVIPGTLFDFGNDSKNLRITFESMLSAELYKQHVSVPRLMNDHLNVLSILGFKFKIGKYFRQFEQAIWKQTLQTLSQVKGATQTCFNLKMMTKPFFYIEFPIGCPQSSKISRSDIYKN